MVTLHLSWSTSLSTTTGHSQSIQSGLHCESNTARSAASSLEPLPKLDPLLFLFSFNNPRHQGTIMSSPPSVNSLKISEEESSTKPTATESSTSTSAPSAPSSGDEKPPVAPNGEAKATGSAQHLENTSTPAPAPTQPSQQRPPPTQTQQRAPPPSRPSSSNMPPQRPSPGLPAASAPNIPGRPGAGGPMRGGIQGPMGMGMRGRGGPSRGAPALPPSLQAKMDAVSLDISWSLQWNGS